MGPEFVEYRVIVPVSEVQGFEKALRRFPQLQIVSNEYPQVVTWPQELSQLKYMIDGAKRAVNEGNNVAIRAFEEIMNEANELTATLRKKSWDSDSFVKGTLLLFDTSYDEYAKFAFRPVGPRRGGVPTYKRLSGLTPREIRVLIQLGGLNGTRSDLPQIGNNEGLAYPWKAFSSAKTHLFWYISHPPSDTSQ